MALLSMVTLNYWISSFFAYFSAPLFTVGTTTFSFLDVFLGGVKLSLIGVGVGYLIFRVKDRR